MTRFSILRPGRIAVLALLGMLMLPSASMASHIAGIRITQTGNTGLQINADVTGFYTAGSTESTMYLGTYYNHVPAVDWGDGNTVPAFGVGPSTGIPLVATSTIIGGIPYRAFRGSFSHSYGTPGSYTISANTSCCPVTTPTYALATGTRMTTTFTTSTPFSTMATVTTSFVQNTHGVIAVPPGFSKSFAPGSVNVGAASTLTFTIDNTGSTMDDNALAFSDNLPAGLIIATPSNVANTCTGGTLTATSGTSVISYTGGVISAGAACTINVDVVANAPAVLVNTTGDLTSAFGNSGTAGDTLTVTASAPGFAKAFAPSTVGVGVPSTLTFTIDNSANAAMAMALDFTDNLPAGLTVASPANSSTSCTGGTLTAASGTAAITYTGGSLAANTSCTINADVIAATTGSFVNTTGNLTSSFGNSGTASDTLDVASSPIFTKAFNPAEIPTGSSTTLTFTIDNSANVVPATGLAFTDVMPPGMTVAAPPNAVDGCAGALTAVAGSDTISYTGGSVAAGVACTISVDITTSALGGALANDAGVLSSSLGPSTPGSAISTLAVLFESIDLPAVGTISVLMLGLGLVMLALVRLRRKRASASR